MDNFRKWFNRTDVKITNWMARYGVLLLRISLGQRIIRIA